MVEKKIICIICPLGCDITVRGEGNTVGSIEGHTCKRGEQYASEEFLAPVRILTTSVKVTNAKSPLVPVRSRDPVPKELLLKCMERLRSLELKAPVGLYDVVVPNILDTGVDIVTTTAMEALDQYPDDDNRFLLRNR